MKTCIDHEEMGFVVVFDNNIDDVGDYCPVCKMQEAFDKFDFWKEEKKKRKGQRLKKIDASKAPDTAPYFAFVSDKWGYDYARNALLHYIEQKGLSEDCEKWLDKNFPSDRT